MICVSDLRIPLSHTDICQNCNIKSNETMAHICFSSKVKQVRVNFKHTTSPHAKLQDKIGTHVCVFVSKRVGNYKC